jgi:hypothetical protein
MMDVETNYHIRVYRVIRKVPKPGKALLATNDNNGQEKQVWEFETNKKPTKNKEMNRIFVKKRKCDTSCGE